MNDDESVVSVEDLRQVMNRALDNLQAQVGERVELDNDFFWSVPPELAYDVYTQPQPEQLTVGQLSESWSNLARLNEAAGEVPAYALVWLADVLKALGHQTR
ncbi:hypothetical protein [Saccharopolyspora dendranthemae]|uniref:Uncharacterized protein n=1 Tax=Saccharopolyspora dendranthemae TaxID=1181886 RepID=A0A561V7P8_9PSEU|nr:hypothetical protein [Saccharopolyspora dendranthemae]TWG07641.1 hypothetical protein FHU35_11258 [Saccharopolyspora dendranthemae]